MRKAPVTSAALAAALFVLAPPAISRALPSSGTSASGPAADVPLLAGGPVVRASAKSPASERNRLVIHQVESGDVVLDSIEVVSVEAHGPPVAGAIPTVVQPPAEAARASAPEVYDHPPAPCPPEDTPVIEAHVHVADAETPEKAVSEVDLPRAETPGIKRLARRLGSLFRPKSAKARVRPHDVDLSELLAENFLIPVAGVDRARLRDSFLEARGQYARHLAIDIGAPRGTPILATDDGEIVKLTRERRGGITIYQKDPSGRYLFFYCHLSRYAQGLSVGKEVSKGEVIGYVGSTGRVIGGPHLHFSITRLPEDDDNLREGLAINPYLLFLAGVP